LLLEKDAGGRRSVGALLVPCLFPGQHQHPHVDTRQPASGRWC
jgi:hypothetical protein